MAELICSWCGAVMDGDYGVEDSHGMCLDCHDEAMAELDAQEEEDEGDQG